MQIIPDHLIPRTQDVAKFLLSDCLWDCECSLWKLLLGPPGKSAHQFKSHVDSPHLCYSHSPPQHLDTIPINFSSYCVHVPTGDTIRHVPSNHTSSHHLGRRWAHGEYFNPRQEKRFTVQFPCHTLYQEMSCGPKVPIVIPLSLLSFVSVGRSMSLSAPPIQVVHQNMGSQFHNVSQPGFSCLNRVHITPFSSMSY